MNKNAHISEFLDYYVNLNGPPEYAVLINGAWGSGKTWFIKNKLEEFKAQGVDYLYVSLYGITRHQDIVDSFFRQLHPKLSHKGMQISGQILKGVLKATTRWDLDKDGNSETTISSNVPDLKLSSFLTNTSNHILVFDDLERCSMTPTAIMGYINTFVEHEGNKVIVVANEAEIKTKTTDPDSTQEPNPSGYERIKEKLIGKTFELQCEVEPALRQFLSVIKNKELVTLLTQNQKLVEEIFINSGYNNLRHLKQSLWDFERLYELLSTKVQKKDELVIEFLKIFLVFSIETKAGIIPSEVLTDYRAGLSAFFIRQNKNEPEKKKDNLFKAFRKYPDISFMTILLEGPLWEAIINKGIYDKRRITEALEGTSYFYDENTPDWRKLWSIRDLTDEEYVQLINSVESNFQKRSYKNLGELRHVVGLFFKLSEMGIYEKTYNEIYNDGVAYINDLFNTGELAEVSGDKLPFRIRESYGSLHYHGQKHKEFKDFLDYLEAKIDEAISISRPDKATGLLEMMTSLPDDFLRVILWSEAHQTGFHDVPIFSYMAADHFIMKFLELPPNTRNEVGNAFTQRYTDHRTNSKLVDDLPWLKTVKLNLEQLISSNTEKSLKFALLEKEIIPDFEKAIKDLEDTISVLEKEK